MYSLIAAVTIDGRIAKSASHMSDWTSVEDKHFMHEELDKSDVIIVGNNTYKIAIEPLSKRNCIVFTRSINGIKKESDLLTYANPEKIGLEEYIQEKGYKKNTLLGGASVYSYYLEKDLIDNLYLTVEPIIFGTGIPLFNTESSVDKKYKLVSIKELNSTGSILLYYQPVK